MRKVHGKDNKYNDAGEVRVDPRYENPGWWETLDTRLYNATLEQPWIVGAILRFLLALAGSNHQEPMPIGNNPHVTNLWADKPQWVRYILWRLRNPWEDMRKFYLGYGLAFYSDQLWVVDVADNKYTTTKIYAPWGAPVFPNIYVYLPANWEFFIGFKKRGMFSISLRKD